MGSRNRGLSRETYMVDPNRRDTRPTQQGFPSRLKLMRDKDRPGGIRQPEEIGIDRSIENIPVQPYNTSGMAAMMMGSSGAMSALRGRIAYLFGRRTEICEGDRLLSCPLVRQACSRAGRMRRQAMTSRRPTRSAPSSATPIRCLRGRPDPAPSDRPWARRKGNRRPAD